MLPQASFMVLLYPVLSIPVSLTCFFTFHTWTLFLAFCLLLLFSKVPSSPSSSIPLSRCTIYHSLPPSHLSLSLLPSLCLSLLCFSSGSPLIKLLCLLPPCPVSTHTSHTSLSHFLSPSFSFHIFIMPLCTLPDSHGWSTSKLYWHGGILFFMYLHNWELI